MPPDQNISYENGVEVLTEQIKETYALLNTRDDPEVFLKFIDTTREKIDKIFGFYSIQSAEIRGFYTYFETRKNVLNARDEAIHDFKVLLNKLISDLKNYTKLQFQEQEGMVKRWKEIFKKEVDYYIAAVRYTDERRNDCLRNIIQKENEIKALERTIEYWKEEIEKLKVELNKTKKRFPEIPKLVAFATTVKVRNFFASNMTWIWALIVGVIGGIFAFGYTVGTSKFDNDKIRLTQDTTQLHNQLREMTNNLRIISDSNKKKTK